VTAGEPATHQFAGDGSIPTSPLPALVYRGLEMTSDPGRAEQAFAANNWLGASADLLVAGGYPDGMEWDVRRTNSRPSHLAGPACTLKPTPWRTPKRVRA
jgi:uncharacterized protein YjlB